MKSYSLLGIQIPEILLPKKDVDLTKWAVIACDQFTSEPEYWNNVNNFVGNSPSSLNLVLPEINLGRGDLENKIRSVNQAMVTYVNEDLFDLFNGLILVERSFGLNTRHGLMLALDLEQYDFSPGSQSLIRATEQTIIERLPPRIRIRQDALVEVPHTMVLIDDPNHDVIGPLISQKSSLIKLYDFELMLGSGHLRGFGCENEDLERSVVSALEKLKGITSPDKNHIPNNEALLFAVGDGNHSLATAKSIWENTKSGVSANHPARYSLVEIVNIHDPGLVFQPIHRLLYGVKGDIRDLLSKHFNGRVEWLPCSDIIQMSALIEQSNNDVQKFGLISKHYIGIVHILDVRSPLVVGTLQPFLDNWFNNGGIEKIDYVHGSEIVSELGSQPGNLGILLPSIDKNNLFMTVIHDGMLPRKSFSMGEAKEKRFYLESRKIK